MLRRSLPWMVLGMLATVSCGDTVFDEFARTPGCDTLDTDGACHDLHGSSGAAATATPTSTGSTGSASSTGPGATSAGPGDDTTGDTHEAGVSTTGGGGSGGDEPDGEPLAAKLTAWPSPMLQVGTVNLTLKVEGAAVSVDLYDGETLLLAGAAPEGELYSFAVTSDDHPGDGLHVLRAVVRDQHDHTVEAVAELEIDVAAGGAQDWAYVEQKKVSAYSSVAMLEHDIAVAGYQIADNKVYLAVARLDRTTGAPISGPRVLDPVVWSGYSRGPAIAVGPDGAVYVAATHRIADTTTRALYKLRMDGPMPVLVWGEPVLGLIRESADAIAMVGDRLVVAGAIRTGVNPDRYDLRVWWLSPESGALLYEAPFAAQAADDPKNLLTERAYGVAAAGDGVVVVGTREVEPKNQPNKSRTRTVVLRYTAHGTLVDEWTSPGDVMPEDAALGVTATKDGGYAITGWARKEPGHKRDVLTRRFAPGGAPLWERSEFAGADETIGHAVAEDIEGKLIIAAARKRPGTDYDAWIFAATGAGVPRTWEVLRNGAGNGPDEAVALTLDPLGHVHVVGSELTGLEIHALALRLFP